MLRQLARGFQGAAVDSLEDLLVELHVLVEHAGAGGTRLNLRLNDGVPELLGLDSLLGPALSLVPVSQTLEQRAAKHDYAS